MKLDDLTKLYVSNLKDMRDAEHQMTEALPKLIEKASGAELKAALEEHLAITESHLETVEELLEAATGSKRGKKCKGMEGLVEEGKEILESEGDPSVIDAGLIMAAQKAEHYEMASYGSLQALAKILGNHEAVETLGEILDEERRADRRLSEIAESLVNVEAAHAGAG